MTLALSWTDQFFLIILLFCFVSFLRSTRRAHTRLALKHIFKKPIAVSSALVLMFFLTIGVLDSIHLNLDKNRTDVSVLDVLLAPLGDTYEQSYSSPFALTLFSTELVMVGDKAAQVFPRLHYVSSIKDERAKMHTIMQTIGDATWMSILFVMLFGVVFRLAGIKPTKSVGITLSILFFLTVLSYLLSRTFHILGTGQIGQDIFYYAVKSIRTGLIIGILTTLFMMPLALFAGIAAGYFGGLVDDAIQYVYTTLSSIPGVLLITASVLSMQTYIANHPQYFKTLAQSADARLLALCFILGLTSWTSLCRLLRAEALKLREIDFVLAATALGSGPFRIIRKHLLPNVMHIVIITLVLDFSFLVLAEAVLSYVGVGVSPLTISWGNMINAARLELAREPVVWWPMFAAFTFMFTLVLASNLFADVVRDAFDPHTNHE